MNKIELYDGDCLEIMDELIAKGVKVDFIITDLPYGTTSCLWDQIIPYEAMWDRIKKIRKDSTAIALYGQEPFSSMLRASNIKEYKYDWYWQKERPTNVMQVKRRAGKVIENISMFYAKQCTYNPQKTIHTGELRTNKIKNGSLGELIDNNKGVPTSYRDDRTRYPLQILKFNRDCLTNNIHPTQKPLALSEYLIKTFTNEGDTILDFTMGSGGSIRMANRLNRNAIGIDNGKCEQDKSDYYGMPWADIVEDLIRKDNDLL